MGNHVRIFLVAIAVLGAGCSRSEENPVAVVAEGEGFSITADEFRKRIAEQPPEVRSRLTTVERKKELLETMIRFELLVAEARKRGLDQDPEVQDAFKKLLVQKLMRGALEPKGNRASDGDVQTYYEQHRAEFVKPERVRIGVVLFVAPAGSPARAGKGAEARKALTRLKAEERRDPLAFSSVARELSEDPSSRARGGDAGLWTVEELSKLYSPELARAAFALKEAGEVSGVVETPQGFAILKLLDRQPASERTLDQVRPQLAARLGREERSRAMQDLFQGLRSSSSVKIDEAELEKVSAAEAGGTQTQGDAARQ